MKKRLFTLLVVMLTFCLFFALPVSAEADSEPPVLNSLKLQATSMTAPGEIEIIGDATDDLSGVTSFYVVFRCEELEESISTHLSKNYWDPLTGKNMEYSDGKYHGFLKSDEYQESGTFKINYSYLYDDAGNSCWYYAEPSSNQKALPTAAKNLKFTVKATNPDSEPPVLKTLALKSTSMTAPGEIEIIGDATDDNSGVTSFYVVFRSEELEESISTHLSKNYWDPLTGKNMEYSDGKYHGFLKSDEYQESGTFKISYSYLYDDAGNSCWYYAEPSSNQKALPTAAKSLKFTVQGVVADTEPPVLKSLQLCETAMAAPGEIEIIGDATDDNSGVTSFYVVFRSEELEESISTHLSKNYWDPLTGKNMEYSDGKYHGFLKCDEYQEPGTFKINYSYLYDDAGNSCWYYAEPSSNQKALPTAAKNLKFTVYNGKVPIVITAQPKTTYTQKGGTAKATVKAVGEELTYQWYIKNAGATKYSKSSVKTATYSCTMSDTSKDRLVYCVITDKEGNTLKCDTVRLRMAATVTTEPKTAYAKIGEKVSATVGAAGDGLTYTWYIKNAGQTKYSKSSVTTPTYTTKMSTTTKDRYVYCVVTDKYGKTDRSKTITFRAKASVTTEPKTTYTKKGATAKVNFTAVGDGLTYTWYIKNAGATKYGKSSVTSSAYTVKMSDASKDRLVYCIVTDQYGYTVKTETVRLRMAATITTQPTNVIATNGTVAETSVTAAGDGLTYQWYIKNAGQTSFSKSSATTASYACKMSSAANGRQVYCVVTDKYGKTHKSNTVTLKMA